LGRLNFWGARSGGRPRGSAVRATIVEAAAPGTVKTTERHLSQARAPFVGPNRGRPFHRLAAAKPQRGKAAPPLPPPVQGRDSGPWQPKQRWKHPRAREADASYWDFNTSAGRAAAPQGRAAPVSSPPTASPAAISSTYLTLLSKFFSPFHPCTWLLSVYRRVFSLGW
jgi:hypothetical protein